MDKSLVEEIVNYRGNAEYLAVATVISVRGSSPGRTGSQMLIYPEGEISGTIGGGANEAGVIDSARRLMKRGGCEKCTFQLTAKEAAAEGGICGGVFEVFIETIKVGI